MQNNNLHLVASNLTIAYFNGQNKLEPLADDDIRSSFYEHSESESKGKVSVKDVFKVYQQFLSLLNNETAGK